MHDTLLATADAEVTGRKAHKFVDSNETDPSRHTDSAKDETVLEIRLWIVDFSRRSFFRRSCLDSIDLSQTTYDHCGIIPSFSSNNPPFSTFYDRE